jgi:ABC-type Zn uptake system ZnuABC Zn-binding protein ZnuA
MAVVRVPHSLAAIALSGLIACSGARSNEDALDSTRLRIVTTVAPITNLVHNVAGDLAQITGLVPEGVNSHTFEPAPSDAKVLAEAHVVFVNGLHLELPSIELAEQNISPNARIVTLADQTISESEWIFDFSFPKENGDPNPHLWTNPVYAKRYAVAIAETLAQLDPDNAATYRSNAEQIGQRFDDLIQALETATATVPRESRKLLTYHDSFPYFARRFDWTVIGAIQPSDFSEPTAREVADLIKQIREENIPAIFGSEVFPSSVLETIANETGVTHVDDLRDDDLPAESGSPDHSLLGLLVFDFKTMIEALGGSAEALESVDVSNLHSETTVSYR